MFIHHKTCESSFADTPFPVVSNPVKNIITGIPLFKHKKTQRVFLSIQDMLGLFLNILQEFVEISETIVVFSVIDELRKVQLFFETSEVVKIERPNDPHHWLSRDFGRRNAFRRQSF